jgi:dTDP-4-amino-4,6-dideoxy-D-galactose acyltransferase
MTVLTSDSQKEKMVMDCEAYHARASAIDTHYFGVPTAIVVLKQGCPPGEDLDRLLDFMQPFSLVMITNKGNNPINNHWLGRKTSAFLTDVNVQLRKKVCSPGEGQYHASISDAVVKNEQIIHLAETSFKYSRFLNDPHLQAEKARGIYADIVRNAFEKPGRFFAQYEAKGMITGFVLFSMNAQTLSATVELIAIDPNQTGRGIGPSIIRSVEHFVCQNGMETVWVGTQLDNIQALKFYTSYGFQVMECSSIYHYWPNGGSHLPGPDAFPNHSNQL